jgi:DNA-binding PadR family transcriptional regulator
MKEAKVPFMELYPVLARLEFYGMIARVGEKDDLGDNTYRLTDYGLQKAV